MCLQWDLNKLRHSGKSDGYIHSAEFTSIVISHFTEQICFANFKKTEKYMKLWSSLGNLVSKNRVIFEYITMNAPFENKLQYSNTKRWWPLIHCSFFYMSSVSDCGMLWWEVIPKFHYNIVQVLLSAVKPALSPASMEERRFLCPMRTVTSLFLPLFISSTAASVFQQITCKIVSSLWIWPLSLMRQ